MGSDGPARRREIEDSTAARLAEIVAAAEQAAKRVIDEAEVEARSRLADANAEADRIVAERLAGLSALTDEIGAQAEALRRGAEELQRALADARDGIDAGGAPGAGTFRGSGSSRPEPVADFGARKPSSPSLTVLEGAVGPRAVEEPAAPESDDGGAERGAAHRGASSERRGGDERGDGGRAVFPEADEDGAAAGTPAGARLLATQMAVSGSSRAEIEARLRDGFAITDAGAILDAILGPEA
jgi:vacuolar-type H+-ATPase subunit H